MSNWNINDSRNLYNIKNWGNPYFDINTAGHLSVKPTSKSTVEIDLYQVAKEINLLGLDWPVLVRVTDILSDRVHTLELAFESAMTNANYKAKYIPVYPIKVNQQRTVVEHLQSQSNIVGLETGSKPELMIALSHTGNHLSTIICNGYKDKEYIRLALIGQKLGHPLFIVIEKMSELKLVLSESEKMGVKPNLGLRLRLSSIGKGNWQNSGGEKSKFGLSASQVLSAIKQLTSENKLDYLKLIHCHLGSQLPNIRDIQNGLREVSKYFVELNILGVAIDYIDVGGGLGIDYDGSRSRNFCSMNYSIQEYANDIVQAFSQICTAHNITHPHIITESGRAMTAHHSVLITNIINTEANEGLAVKPLIDSASTIEINNLWQTRINIKTKSVTETYHDATHWLKESQLSFTHGSLTLEQKSLAEKIYFDICRTIKPLLSAQSNTHREIIEELNDKLANKYFCNLSIFQSLPDIWAIDQVFPIVPLHRLNEKPDVRATLQDLTCDSDGAIDHYVNGENIESTIAVHNLIEDEDYLLGFFLTGAYQEILGDMHNLFGDTHAINLEISTNGEYELVQAEPGDSIEDVLKFVHFEKKYLINKYNKKIKLANLSAVEEKDFLDVLRDALDGYTYLAK